MLYRECRVLTKNEYFAKFLFDSKSNKHCKDCVFCNLGQWYLF